MACEMCLCVFLLCVCGVQFTAGCSYDIPHLISCSTGESVLLSCLETHLQDKNLQWWYSRSDVDNPEHQLSPDHCSTGQCSTNKLHIYQNLSLSITDLTLEDAGKYWCKTTTSDTNTYIALIIEGCSISVNKTSSVKISRYSGESVMMSCFVQCSARHKPDQWRWKLPNNREMTSTELKNPHEGRVQMSNTSSKFSLLILDLIEKDEGLYSCWINKNQHMNFTLSVKGCVVSESDEIMMSHPGDSVLLSCSCEDDQTKPKHFEWRRADLNKSIVSDKVRSKDRFKTLIHDSPADLSLLISDLSEDDQGTYMCTVNGKQSRMINLTVMGSKGLIMSFLIGLLMLVMLGAAVGIYWKCLIGKKKSQRTDHEDDVTYSTVTQIKGRKPAKDHQQNDVTYTGDTLNKRLQTTKSEDDVLYSSVVHIKSHRLKALHMSTADTTLYSCV